MPARRTYLHITVRHRLTARWRSPTLSLSLSRARAHVACSLAGLSSQYLAVVYTPFPWSRRSKPPAGGGFSAEDDEMPDDLLWPTNQAQDPDARPRRR